MPVQRVECHPYAAENAGRVALRRGPILYCVEGADNPDVDPRDVVLSAGGEWLAAFEPDLLGGMMTLRGPAAVVAPGEGWEGRLYRGAVQAGGTTGTQARIDLTAIPYYAWANRQPGPMQVWLRMEQ
jgi:DUF1680 family protein